MPWFVQYRLPDGEHVERFNDPEAAILAACGLIDQGVKVLGLGEGDLCQSLGAESIATLYAARRRFAPNDERAPRVGTESGTSRGRIL